MSTPSRIFSIVCMLLTGWMVCVFCFPPLSAYSQSGLYGQSSLGNSNTSQKVTLLTWNLRWFPGGTQNASPQRAKDHLLQTQEILQKLQPAPDIICLQEIASWDATETLVQVLSDYQVYTVSRFPALPNQKTPGPQQLAIAGRFAPNASWSEEFKRTPAFPPRGFSFAAIEHPHALLFVYSVHLKSNLGDANKNEKKREDAAKQILRHIRDMHRTYSNHRKPIVTIVAGDFNTDPQEARFSSEKTYAIFQKELIWPWKNTPLSQRITLPKTRRFPAASFDGFFIHGAHIENIQSHPVSSISDHYPVTLTLLLPE